MEEKIIINPVTRISGFLELEVIVAGHTIVDAKASGMLFRGFETMLQGRPPLDAIYFTERICGICSTAHAMGSALALEAALKVRPTNNQQMIRDFIHGCEFLQNHLRHFYQYTLPDYIQGPAIYPLYPVSHQDFRLPEKQNTELQAHYLESTTYSRMAHEMLAVLGGKAPHNHGIFVGGVTVNLDIAKYAKIKSLLTAIKEFTTVRMVDDVYQIAKYYPEYFTKGMGYGNLLSYGLYDKYSAKELTYVGPKVFLEGNVYPFDVQKVSENIYYAWYQAEQVELGPWAETPEPTLAKARAYSWIKAPRYEGHPVEVGPLARMWLSGLYTNGISAMDRTIARVLEVIKIIEVMEELLERITPEKANQGNYEIPLMARGVGLIDTTRGSLGHWLEIEEQRIRHYDIITPSVWNISPSDSRGQKGIVENALIGTVIEDIQHPVEIGRIVRSFDPCISCATHVVSNHYPSFNIRVI